MAEVCNIEIAYTKSAGWCWRCHRHDVNGFNAPDRAEAERLAERHQRIYREVPRG